MLAAILISVILTVLSVPTGAAAAQPYFQDKTITLQVGSGAGGRQDRIARTLARYLTKYTAGNPAIIILNVPGGRGIPAMQKLNRGPKDGTFISMVISSYLESPYFGAPGADYNPRTFVYIGAPSTGKQRNVLVVHRRSGFKTVEDLKKREVILGALSVGHRSYLYGRLIAELLGLKVRWVVGYSTPELYIAIERGEVEGRVNDAASMLLERPEWFEKHEIVPLVAMTLPEELPPVNHPLMNGIPSIMQFAKNEIYRNIIRKVNSTERLGGAMALPPGTPESIRKILEDALLKVGQDPDFRKEWETIVLEGNPFDRMFSGKEVLQGVEIYTDWRPEVMEAYKRLAHEPPK